MAYRRLFSISLSSDLMDLLVELRRVLERTVRRFTDSDDIVSDMITIFDEAVSNAMKHAYNGGVGPVRVDLYVDEVRRRFMLRVYDRGKIPRGMREDMSRYKVDLNRWLEEGKVGGIGLHLIAQLSDAVYWKKLKYGKYLQVEKGF